MIRTVLTWVGGWFVVSFAVVLIWASVMLFLRANAASRAEEQTPLVTPQPKGDR